MIPFHTGILSSRRLAQAFSLFVISKFQASESKGRKYRVEDWFRSWGTTTSTSFCESKSGCHPDSRGWRHPAKGSGPREAPSPGAVAVVTRRGHLPGAQALLVPDSGIRRGVLAFLPREVLRDPGVPLGLGISFPGPGDGGAECRGDEVERVLFQMCGFVGGAGPWLGFG